MLSLLRGVFQTLQIQGPLIRNGRNALSTSTTLQKKNYLQEPEDYSDINLPEKPKLRVMMKVPHALPNQKHRKMKKSLHLIRGPEPVHNALLHEQYGIRALCGGRLRYGHMEMIRLTVGRKLDASRMFAIWRIDDPWQPISKMGIGKRHGGGKGPIDHYVTPIKEGRIIIEVGGKCSYEEVKPWLEQIARLLPFKAEAVDMKTILAKKKLEELEEKRNINPITYKYLLMNRMVGTQNWAGPTEKEYFGKYV
ncbi:39S ribosomal protein L16, mitochondrial [Thrips palmi]|uniref:Large ribosomal subunit protein uL16m n=1 Tax=Thrips palmi TaxID=161013 RepID=A0A6P9A4Z1_THRPL|nr:39S ribosomal protein L16, mitochondrial [Thrips palmi]